MEQDIEKIIEGVRVEIGKGLGSWKSRVAKAIAEAGYRLIPEQTDKVEDIKRILHKHYEMYYLTQGYPLPQNGIDFEEGIASEILSLIQPELKVLSDEELQPSEALKGLLTNLAKGETSEQWVIDNIAYQNKLIAQAQLSADKGIVGKE